MKFAIIAAGEGSRLANEGISAPKPLVEVHGEKLIDRLIRIFLDNNASEIVVICNDLTPLVEQHLKHIQEHGLNGKSVPLRYIVKSTPSSMHSFHAISPWLKDESFVLTTVDTIFREKEFREYVREFQRLTDVDGLMGVTDFIYDEKPLHVGVDAEGGITGFFDRSDDPHYISGGIYGLTPKCIAVLDECIERGESRMRNFQRALVGSGLHLKAFSFGKVLDIDHAEDIRTAEAFLS